MNHSHEMYEADLIGEKQGVARKTTSVSIVVNVFLMFFQIVVGIVAHSQALLADGIHSLSDIISDFIVLLANRHSNAKPDADHNYGHSRYENLASFFLGVALIVVGLGMLWRAAYHLIFADQIVAIHISALVVAITVLFSKELLFRYMLKEAKRVRSSLLVANAWHARSDAASSLVVTLGIIGSLAGFHLFDSIAAAIVGFIVGRMGWSFAWSAIQDLSDRAVDEAVSAEIERKLLLVPGVSEVHELRTRKMGDLAVVDVHLLVDSKISVSEGHFIAELARAKIMEDNHVLDALVHIDPEDDLDEKIVLSQPIRTVVLEHIEHFFAQYDVKIEKVLLHYLHGGMEAEVTISHKNHEIEQIKAKIASIPMIELKRKLRLKDLSMLYVLESA